VSPWTDEVLRKADRPGPYKPCDRAEAAGWKTFPVRIPGPGRSPCHAAPTVLVESMSGGFVTKNCGRCGGPDTLTRGEFGARDLPVNCPECRGPMRPHVPQEAPAVRLPTSNYAFRCDGCRVYIELHWMSTETGKTTRFTHAPGQDVLPVFSPDSTRVMWTSNRDGRGPTQLYIADFTPPKDQ
jgi:hypothetical protein